VTADPIAAAIQTVRGAPCPDGTAKATLQDEMATLGDGPDSVFHDGGTAIVIHAKQDDYKTDPAGNSGPRIACGVIQK